MCNFWYTVCFNQSSGWGWAALGRNWVGKIPLTLNASIPEPISTIFGQSSLFSLEVCTTNPKFETLPLAHSTVKKAVQLFGHEELFDHNVGWYLDLSKRLSTTILAWSRSTSFVNIWTNSAQYLLHQPWGPSTKILSIFLGSVDLNTDISDENSS